VRHQHGSTGQVDAPAHQLFVLLVPVNPNQNAMPDVLVAVQVSRHMSGSFMFECVRE
jgi:hypothetical protein